MNHCKWCSAHLLPPPSISDTRQFSVLTNRHEWYSFVRDVGLSSTHLPKEAWSRSGGHEPSLPDGVIEWLHGSTQGLGGGEGKDGGSVISHHRWSPIINCLPCISVVCTSVNEDSPSPDPPGLGGTSCGSHKWSGGPVMAEISGPGDQLWQK